VDDREKPGVISLIISVIVFLIQVLSDSSHTDSEHNVTLVDKRIEYTDISIEMHHITYRTGHGMSKDIRCSSRIYYSCEVGVKLVNESCTYADQWCLEELARD